MNRPMIQNDPRDAIILSLLANAVYGGHNNSQISHQETEEVNLDARLRQVEGDVREIKSNYLTKEAFYKAGGSTLIALVVTAGIALWTVYSHLDTKVEARFSKIDDKFVQVETNIKNLDIRLTKVESRLDNVEQRLDNVEQRLGNMEKKIDGVDNKLDLLLQQFKR